MWLSLHRFNGGWQYTARYQGKTCTGWGLTRSAALSGRLLAVYELAQA